MSFRLYINNLENGDIHLGIFNDKGGKYIRTVEKFKFAKITSMLEIIVNEDEEISLEILKRITTDCYLQIKNLIVNNVYNLKSNEGKIEFIHEKSFGDDIDSLISGIDDAVRQLSKRGKFISIFKK